MNTFASAVELDSSPVVALTANGMPTNAHTGSALLDLFFVLGSSRGQDISTKFVAALTADPVLAVKSLFWARDIRGGAGERDTFRKLMQVLETSRPDLLQRVINLIPVYGRYDDLAVFQTPALRSQALGFWCAAILAGDALAAKWAPRKGPLANELRKVLQWDPKTYRKWLVQHTAVVENHMCARQWDQINYEHVPSVAGARYQKAFNRRDAERYTAYKTAAAAGEARINAGALFPYDVVRSVKQGDPVAALAQWNALPCLLGDNRILPMVDVSGSMATSVGGSNKSLTALDVAVSLGLYIADKQQGAFQDMWLTFSASSTIKKLQGDLIAKLAQLENDRDWGMNTSLESAFREILRVAVMGEVAASEMPEYLLVMSDMGIDACVEDGNATPMEMARKMFERHGYSLPKIVWWNIAHKVGGYGGDNNFPVTHNENGTVLVSGFSPSILKRVLQAKNVTPFDVMMDTLNAERYQPVADSLQ